MDNQCLGNFDNFNSYGRNIFFATRKIFARFCYQAPKIKYCYEFTKGYFSQSTLKEVIILLQPLISSSITGPTEEHYSFSHAILNNMMLIDFMLQKSKLIIFTVAKKFGQLKLPSIILDQICSTIKL